MYRKGISIAKIAAVTHVAESVIRHHIAIASKQEPGLGAEHQAALPPAAPRVTVSGQRNAAYILALYQAQGRLPVTGRSKQETALAGWLARRRAQAAAGALSPAYAAILDEIPGWRDHQTKRDADQTRWKVRLAEVAAYLGAGNELPRHGKTDDKDERALGVWLHTQRIGYRAGTLTAAKEAQLNQLIPGWRDGRPRGRRRGAKS